MQEKKKEFPWYLLWYFTSAMWLINFCTRMSSGDFDLLVFLNIFVSLIAGIINGRRYKKRQKED